MNKSTFLPHALVEKIVLSFGRSKLRKLGAEKKCKIDAFFTKLFLPHALEEKIVLSFGRSKLRELGAEKKCKIDVFFTKLFCHMPSREKSFSVLAGHTCGN